MDVATRIEIEDDIDRLRQVARLLNNENDKLHNKFQKLLEELGDNDKSRLQKELAALQEMLGESQQARFGKKSERRKKRKAKKRSKNQTGHGPTPQPKLPIESVVHELDDDERTCHNCGGQLQEWSGQEESSEEIDVVERIFIIKKHIRTKYRCECGKCIDTADGPKKLIKGGRYSFNFAIHAALGKYMDHMPLERQCKQAKRMGLNVRSQTLWDQIEALADVLIPTYWAIRGEILSGSWVGADETRWRLMMSRTHKQKGCNVWCIANNDEAFYEMTFGKCHQKAMALLDGFSGIVVCDGYAAYAKAASVNAQNIVLAGGDLDSAYTIAGCWAHARRKFFKAARNFAEADPILDIIDELFELDRKTRRRAPPLLDETRKVEGKKILKRLRNKVLELKVLDSSSLGKARKYLFNHWDKLKVFLEHPELPLDNNLTEGALRAPVLGRKNFYGCRSEDGLKVTAIFYTITETAKRAGVDVIQYLRFATERAIDRKGNATTPAQFLALNS